MVRQMRVIAYVLLASTAVACASGSSGPPVAAPTATPDPPGMPADMPSGKATLPATCATWVVRAARREKTTAVAACQVAPITLSSDVTAEVHPVSPEHVTVRVTLDRESADNLPPAPSLAGKSYDVQAGAAGLAVRIAGGGPAEAGEARRVSALAAAAMPLADADAAGLRRAVEAIADVQVRGTPATEIATTVTPRGERVFTLHVDASESDAGMCHRWTTTASLDGDLALRRGGLIESLALQGPVATTEALCPEGARQSSAEPRACTRGEASIAVDVSCAPVP